MQQDKRRSLTLMILGALALGAGLVWMAQDATIVEARAMLHPCPEAGEDPSLHDDFCPHTPTPTPTNTPAPTRTSTPTPTRTNTPTPGPTNTPTPGPTNTPRPTPTSAPRPTYTPVPANAPRSVAAGPPTDCIVSHAATPAQLCVSGDGIQYYFVGPGVVQIGPYLSSISELAASHSSAPAAVELYRGTNPLTGKPVQIDYLPNEKLIRVSTFYLDTPYSMDKAYIFTVNASYQVTYQAW